jgi:hypothetical protein
VYFVLFVSACVRACDGACVRACSHKHAYLDALDRASRGNRALNLVKLRFANNRLKNLGRSRLPRSVPESHFSDWVVEERKSLAALLQLGEQWGLDLLVHEQAGVRSADLPAVGAKTAT